MQIAMLICLSSHDTSERVASSRMLQVKHEVNLNQKFNPSEIINTF